MCVPSWARLPSAIAVGTVSQGVVCPAFQTHEYKIIQPLTDSEKIFQKTDWKDYGIYIKLNFSYSLKKSLDITPDTLFASSGSHQALTVTPRTIHRHSMA